MKSLKKLPLLTLTLIFFLFIASAHAISSFSVSWSFNAQGPILQHALDTLGNVTYFGSGTAFGITNYLYAFNLTSGAKLWQYNTSIPINYISHFKFNTTLDAIIAGTGGSTTLINNSYVLAKTPSNATLWKTTNLNSSVTSLASVESNVTGSEDVMAGLANGTLFRLSGNNGLIQWRNECNGTIYDIVRMQDGSIIVGSSRFLGPVGSHIYRFEKNGTLKWAVPYDFPLTTVAQLGNTNNVVVAVRDGLIHMLDASTGQESLPWPFSDPAGKIVTDLLAAQDYTADGIADIVASLNDGSLMIVDSQNATLIRGPQTIATANIYYIQYMYFYEGGNTFLNKTLAVSAVDFGPPFAYSVRGINATTLTTMKQYNTTAIAQNLINIEKFTSFYTGDLVFTANDTVFNLSGTDIIVPEFASNLVLVSLLISIWLLMLVFRRRS